MAPSMQDKESFAEEWQEMLTSMGQTCDQSTKQSSKRANTAGRYWPGAGGQEGHGDKKQEKGEHDTKDDDLPECVEDTQQELQET